MSKRIGQAPLRRVRERETCSIGYALIEKHAYGLSKGGACMGQHFGYTPLRARRRKGLEHWMMNKGTSWLVLLCVLIGGNGQVRSGPSWHYGN